MILFALAEGLQLGGEREEKEEKKEGKENNRGCVSGRGPGLARGPRRREEKPRIAANLCQNAASHRVHACTCVFMTHYTDVLYLSSAFLGSLGQAGDQVLVLRSIA
ncbi:unnamed protein product [Pleuronectes platessa]|uniref:Uncharacterized protein n=1 Tax=Pleuronectes platessa TaxID=8262 RepID=A0A9N7YNL4_PLEPL|nr:unnamed protein product [Pleuronectes platessa]